MEEKKKCYHFSREITENDTVYCKECLAILDKHVYWVGTLKVGKMEKSYQLENAGLNIKELIEDHLGSVIDLENVVIVEGSWAWDRNMEVGFSIGKSQMFADIEARKSEEYTATDKYYAPIPVTEEVEAKFEA